MTDNILQAGNEGLIVESRTETSKMSRMQFSYGIQSSNFNQTPVIVFERDFNEEVFYQWINQNWSLSMWYSAVYIVIIFGGRYYMQKRPPFEIRPALALWSAILGAFSIFGAARTIPETVYVLKNYGWDFSVCSPSYTKGPTGFWTFLFTISKVYELGDTIFIILRKQNLIFLHWYHHVTVLVYTWYSYTEHLGPGRWFITMNYAVHSVMYTYYALRALRIRVPRQIAMSITTMQILQMIIGLLVNYNAYLVKSRGDFCQTTYQNLKLSSTMYGSYFVLFTYFFLKTYLWKSAPKQPEYTSIKKVD